MFLEAVLSGEEDLVKCANKAYDASLRRYHGWLVRGIFNVSCSYVAVFPDSTASFFFWHFGRKKTCKKREKKWSFS